MNRRKGLLKICVVFLMLIFMVFVNIGCEPEEEVVEEPEEENDVDIEDWMDVEYDFEMGGVTPGHTAFTITEGHGSLVEEHLDNVSWVTEHSGGSYESLDLVIDGVLDGTTCGNIAPYEAVRGEGRYEGEQTDIIKTWIPQYTYGTQLVVLEDSDIEGWLDLEGKSVGVGGTGSVGEVVNRMVLEALGLGEDYAKIDEYTIPHAEMVDGIKTGMLDAIIVTTGIPSPGIIELQATHDIRIVPMTEEEADTAGGASDLMSPGVVPANIYEDGVPAEDAPIAVGYTHTVVREDVPEDVVYAATRVIWENKEDLVAVHVSQEYLDPQMIVDGLIPIAPLHPGAERYYKEMGWVD